MTAPDGDLRLPLDLDEIEQRLVAVTKGPWMLSGRYPQQIMANDDGLVLVAETFTSPEHSPAEAEFIAHARTDVPALVDRVRELEAERVAAGRERNEELRQIGAWMADARRAFEAVERYAKHLRARSPETAVVGDELLRLLGERFVTPEPEQ